MIAGLHHLGLTVRDVEASAAWYADVLGFRRSGEFEAPDGSRSKLLLRHAAANTVTGAAVLVFRNPDNIQLELFFDPAQTASP